MLTSNMQALTTPPKEVRLTLNKDSLDYRVGETVWYKRAEYQAIKVIPKRLLVMVLRQKAA